MNPPNRRTGSGGGERGEAVTGVGRPRAGAGAAVHGSMAYEATIVLSRWKPFGVGAEGNGDLAICETGAGLHGSVHAEAWRRIVCNLRLRKTLRRGAQLLAARNCRESGSGAVVRPRPSGRTGDPLRRPHPRSTMGGDRGRAGVAARELPRFQPPFPSARLSRARLSPGAGGGSEGARERASRDRGRGEPADPRRRTFRSG